MKEVINKEILNRVNRLMSAKNKENFSPSHNKRQIKLIELSDRLYKFIDSVCWKTEATLAKELGVSQRQIKYAKAYLYINKYVDIKLQTNGKRMNPKHVILKTDIFSKDFKQPEIKWEILNYYSRKSFQDMQIEEQLEIYNEAKLQFVPFHYPKFKKNWVACSCARGRHCEQIGKHPAIKTKDLDFSKQRTYEKLKGYWTEKDNQYNIGFLTNNFAVIDIDLKHGGAYSLETIEDIYGEIPRGLYVESGNGFHLYVSNILSSTVNLLDYPGIDVRSKGGFIIAPFSQHRNGKYYEWQSISVPESLPKDLLSEIQLVSADRIRKSVPNKNSRNRNPYLLEIINSNKIIPHSKRNRTLFEIASGERGYGKDYESILNFIDKINQKNCQTPLGKNELKGIVKSVISYLPNSMKELDIKP